MVAGTAVRGAMRGLFEGLVPAEVIDAHERPLARNGCAKDQAEALVGDAGLVAALTRAGDSPYPAAQPGRPGAAAHRRGWIG